jgi:hypothetical protein
LLLGSHNPAKALALENQRGCHTLLVHILGCILDYTHCWQLQAAMVAEACTSRQPAAADNNSSPAVGAGIAVVAAVHMMLVQE